MRDCSEIWLPPWPPCARWEARRRGASVRGALLSALQQSRQVPDYGIRSARPAGSNSRALDSKGGVPMDAQADNSQGATAGARGRIADKARDTATHLQDELQERAGAVLETAHAKVGNAQAVIADQLSAGAEVI